MQTTLFNNRSLKQSLRLTFFSIISVFTFIFIIILIMLSSIYYHFQALQSTDFPLMEAADTAASNHLSTQNTMYKLCLADDESKQTEYFNEQNGYDMALQGNLKYILKHASSYKSNITNIQHLLQEALPYRNQAILYCKQDLSDKALALLEEQYFPRMTLIQKELANISTQLTSRNAHFLDFYKKQIFAVIGFALCCFFIILMISIRLIQKLITEIQNPLTEIGSAMNQMANGQLDFDLSYTAHNELGNLADQMRYMVTQLLTYISNISNTLTDLSQKNYDTSVNVEYHGTFVPIKESLLTIITELNEVISAFKHTALQITEDAETLITSSHRLSESSLTQSASVQELAATIESISEEVQHNADTAKHVSTSSSALEDQLSKGNLYTHKLLESMQQTTASTQEIQKIISLIEKISRQTHLLALNASIEASRAGQNGRGFTVIADQMNHLAIETSHAVKLTKELISSTIHDMDESNQLTYETTSIIDCAATLAESISSHIKDVALSCTNQAESIKQYHLSIEEMTCSIDSNAKMAAQLHTEGNALCESAKALSRQISAFHLQTASASPVEVAALNETPIHTDALNQSLLDTTDERSLIKDRTSTVDLIAKDTASTEPPLTKAHLSEADFLPRTPILNMNTLKKGDSMQL